MSSKSAEKSSMNNAAITADLAKEAAAALVKRAEYRTGSRMTAYADVARDVGAKASWIRWFVNCPKPKEPNWTVGWNLLDQYNRICARVEQEIETERSQVQALKRQIDAATSPVARMVESAARAETTGAEKMKATKGK